MFEVVVVILVPRSMLCIGIYRLKDTRGFCAVRLTYIMSHTSIVISQDHEEVGHDSVFRRCVDQAVKY